MEILEIPKSVGMPPCKSILQQFLWIYLTFSSWESIFHQFCWMHLTFSCSSNFPFLLLRLLLLMISQNVKVSILLSINIDILVFLFLLLVWSSNSSVGYAPPPFSNKYHNNKMWKDVCHGINRDIAHHNVRLNMWNYILWRTCSGRG